MRYKVRLSYNGADLSGWQHQPNASSVQDELERALSLIFRTTVKVTGAGRTDAKVNAVNYVSHFDIDEPIALDATYYIYKINAILPKNIVVHEILPAEEGFHARFSATSREYHYFVHLHKDPFAEQFSYLCRYPLDIGRMNEAAGYLPGRHDFRCFEKKGGNNKTSICTVYEAGWSTYTPAHAALLGFPAPKGSYLVFSIRADRFLRNMVRAVVGSLIDVGRGRRTPEWIRELIETGTRSDAGESVPGNALFLNKVDYHTGE